MAELTTRKADGTEGGTITVDDGTFGVTPNVPLMHQVVTAQLAAARAGTQSTKTRSEVSGGGAKPFKQKGTGRSRQGTTRAPQWTGGGVALGPKPRSYKQRTPKKMVKAALRSALSDRFSEGHVVVLEDGFGFTEAKTRNAVALLDALDLDGTVLVVVGREDEAAMKAFRNLPEAQLILDEELNAYDVLCNDWIVFTQATLPAPAPAGSSRDGAVHGRGRPGRDAASTDDAGTGAAAADQGDDRLGGDTAGAAAGAADDGGDTGSGAAGGAADDADATATAAAPGTADDAGAAGATAGTADDTGAAGAPAGNAEAGGGEASNDESGTDEESQS
jgi:large subunit ribosomal protein L4